MHSVWSEYEDRPHFDALRESCHTDVLIIGGGLTGILCAHALRRAGVDCVLLEANRICGGITKNTTAKITLQHGLLYDKLIRRFGVDHARLYLQAQQNAMAEYERLCGEIPCDYVKRDSFVYTKNARERVEKEVVALERLGLAAEFSDAPELPFSVAGAVRVRDQAQFHPLQFAYGVARELPIYENTKVTGLAPKKAVTPYGEITCERMIVATHFPILNKHGGYFLKLYQHRSYVLALEGATIDGMYVDEDEQGLSFREYGGRLLLGGGSHRTGKKGGAWRELEEVARTYYRGAHITHRWATQDCMTLDGLPYIGRYARSTPDLFVATGFNKWGMTSAMVSALLLCDLLCGKSNEYAALFDPSRSVMRPQLAANAFHSLVGLLTPTTPRCPHLGCALKYNPDEHTWDCPCHGSRFTLDGQLIDNPATDDKHL